MTAVRFTDARRVDELYALVQGVFGALAIDPPSSVLKESRDDFVRRLATETCLVIERDGALVASVFCAPAGDALYIGRLAVAPAFRRQGLASVLVEAARHEARRLGLARLTLGARIALDGNLALFRRHGFAIIRATCHPGFSEPTSYDMELRLTDA